ncbi:MAG: hypothetical protein P4L92_21820, partial [Rudaea sp.]|nr:hypothetical protein [Rudaea sp.]
MSGVDRFAMDLDFKKANSIVIASASEAIHRASGKQARMDCFVASAPRNDVTLNSRTYPHSRGADCARAVQDSFCPTEGAGNAGRPMRPIAARAMVAIERTRVGEVTPEIARHSPRNGFTAYNA